MNYTYTRITFTITKHSTLYHAINLTSFVFIVQCIFFSHLEIVNAILVDIHKKGSFATGATWRDGWKRLLNRTPRLLEFEDFMNKC